VDDVTGGYAVDNDSSMRVQLTGVAITDNANDAMQQATSLSSSMRDKYMITLKPNATPKDLMANNETGDTYNPIDTIATSPLTFVTQTDDTPTDQGVHIANITYTVKIPEDDLPTNATD